MRLRRPSGSESSSGSSVPKQLLRVRLAPTKLVDASGPVNRSVRGLAPAYAVAGAHGGDPRVEAEAEQGGPGFHPAGHRYDCRMPSKKDMDRLKSEMEELFADLCQVPRLVASRRGFRPAVDVYRAEDPPAITVVIELAGVDPAETELAVADGVLVVRGLRRRSTQQRILHMEVD